MIELQGAGGVGGMLLEQNACGDYLPVYDGNGNIIAYKNDAGNVVSTYAYDPFGNVIAHAGMVFTYKFSTKPQDELSGMYYYGYRFYQPELGRWINRDPIREKKDKNLYIIHGNSTIGWFDILGLVACCGGFPLRQGMSCCNGEYQYNKKTHCCKRFPIPRRNAEECKRIFDACIKGLPRDYFYDAISVNMLPFLAATTASALVGFGVGGPLGAGIGAALAGAFFTTKTIGDACVGISNFSEYSQECRLNFEECMDCSK